MGLAWQQGPLAAGSVGHFLTAEPLPDRHTHRPVVLYESGFAPRWYVHREEIDEHALEPAAGQTFCPYKGLADYYTIGAQSVGFSGALITRPGNAPLPLRGVPQPDVIATDLLELAERL